MKVFKLLAYSSVVSLIGLTWLYILENEKRKAYRKGVIDGDKSSELARQAFNKYTNSMEES